MSNACLVQHRGSARLPPPCAVEIIAGIHQAAKYYYRKQREGAKVKSIYVGRGEIAHMVAQIQSSSPLLERLARTIRSPEQVKLEKAEAALQKATDLIHLITQAALLAAGFHTHHRQWRRKRSLPNRNRKQP